jgi:hypothetical protein
MLRDVCPLKSEFPAPPRNAQERRKLTLLFMLESPPPDVFLRACFFVLLLRPSKMNATNQNNNPGSTQLDQITIEGRSLVVSM